MYFLFVSLFQSLPAPVRRRIKALKKYQAESIKIEAKFYEEVHKLECLYHSKYFPLYDKRDAIVNGKQPKIKCTLNLTM
jgi:Nucleosome assembly protein (NAP).